MTALRFVELAAYTTLIATAIHVFLLLVTGGYGWTLVGIAFDGHALFPSLMVVLALAIASVVIRSRRVGTGVRAKAIVLACALMFVYLANGKTIFGLDTLPARYLPFSILREANFDFNEFSFFYASGMPHSLRLINGRYVTEYPVGAALLALPWYLPSALGRVDPASSFPVRLEKFAAAAIVALSAALLFLTLRRLSSEMFALVVTATYALGTSSFSVSSQALWQHGPSQLGLVATLYCLVRGREEARWVGLAGFPLGLAVISRPTDFLVALPLGLYVLVHHRPQLPLMIVSGLPSILFNIWYNAQYFGDPFRTQFPLPFVASWPWRTPFWEGLTGILVSPGRGLFVYSPIALFSILGWGLSFRKHGDRLLQYLGVGVVLTIVLYAKWWSWWGGGTYGPRLLADLAPLLAVLLYPLADLLRRRRLMRLAFAALLVWSVIAHAVGAFLDDRYWNTSMDVDRFPQHVWLWGDNQLVNPFMRLFNVTMIGLRGLPTSRTHPERVSAKIETDLPRVVTKTGTAPVQFSVTATNTGEVIWLAFPRRRPWSVKLAWKWREGEEVVASGWTPLRYDVFPRGSHRFWVTIDPPRASGSYLLELGLANESEWLGAGEVERVSSIVIIQSAPEPAA